MKKEAKEKTNSLGGIEHLIKKYGKVISSGLEIFEKKKNLKTLSVSPNFDIALNGGILEGTWTIVMGAPKIGKTTMCLQVCANAQKEGRNVIYLDGENRLKNYNLVGVKDLDLSKIQIIHSSQDGEKLSAEDYLTILEQMMQLQENIGAVVVVDSTSSLLPRAELDSEVSGTMRANMPKLLAHWIRKNAQTITKQKIMILVITHHITNTSGYGKHKLPDGGLYLQYQADTLIEFKSAEPWMDGVEKVGQIAECDIICSSMGASGKKCQTYLRYGLGIDKVQESIALAVELGLIDKSGTWMYLVYLDGEVEGYDHDSFKAQGSAKLYEMISSNPQYLEILLRKLKEML